MDFGSPTTDPTKGAMLYSYDRPPSAREVYIRGSLFAPLPRFIQRELGPAGWQEFLKRVDPVASTVLGGEFVALAWYPFTVVTSTVEILSTMGRAMGKPDLLRKMTTDNLDQATRGIFRAIFKIGSPEFMIKRSDHVWKKFYSAGEMTVDVATKGEAIIRLERVPNMTPLYSQVVMYSMQAVIEKAGGVVTRAEMTSDIAKGDPRSEYHYRWK